MLGEITTKNPPSIYQPPQEVIDLTKNVKRDVQQGFDILHTSYPELNDRTPLERATKDQKTFNSYVDESVEDPNEAWKWRGTRSLARNKTMAMHAHLTSGYIIPGVFAQNENQQEDQDVSEVMRDVCEWLTLNSNYRTSFLLATQGMLVNPVTYLEADFSEIYQTIIEKTMSGYEKKEVLDEVLSGFQANVLSVEQVYITNAYQQNIQKQRSISKVRYIEYSEAQAKYGEHENWSCLSPGIKAVLNEEEGMFYSVKDEDHPYLIQELTWMNRRQDGEVCFLNGIYFGNENVEWNPIRHRDNRNAPKYNITPFGYERINEHFFFYKSLINRVGWDDTLLDAMWEVHMNRALLDADQPVATSGDDKIDSDVAFPGAVFASMNKDFSVKPIFPPYSGILSRTIQEVENSMSQSSVSDTETGQLPQASQTATATSQATVNAKILLSGVKQTLGESVRQFGELMVDIILQHVTVPQIDEITGNLNYRSLVLSDQTVNGKRVSKRIKFDEAMLGRDMDEESKKRYSLKLLDEVGYPDNKEHLYVINPHLFSKMKYLVRVEPDTMQPKTREFQQVMMERLYALLRQDPNVETVELLRKFLRTYFESDVDELIKKQPIQQVMGGQTNLPSVPSTLPTNPTTPSYGVY